MRGQRERRGGREREEGSAPQNDHIEEEKKDPGAERGPLASAPHKEQQRKGLQDMRKRIPQGEPRSKVSYMQEAIEGRGRTRTRKGRPWLLIRSESPSIFTYGTWLTRNGRCFMCVGLAIARHSPLFLFLQLSLSL